MRRLTLNQALLPASVLGHDTTMRLVRLAEPLELKYGNFNYGQIEAILNKVCSGEPAVLNSLLKDDVRIVLRRPKANLFDETGRCIPDYTLKSEVEPPGNYYFTQPDFDYQSMLARVAHCFDLQEVITVSSFQERVDAIIERLNKDRNTKDILKGVYLPFYIPQMFVGDLGQMIADILLPAVERSYMMDFPDRVFRNRAIEPPKEGMQGKPLPGRISLFENSGHEILLEALQKGGVVAIHFPNCFLGFSDNAQLEQRLCLPKYFLSAGACDLATAMVAYPKVLARDELTPLMSMSAIDNGDTSYQQTFFRVGKDGLDFANAGGRSYASERYTGGLTVIG